MSKNENPKKLSQQKNQHLFTQCSERKYRVFRQVYYIYVIQNHIFFEIYIFKNNLKPKFAPSK
jgi:hypothetical protein